MLKVLGAKCQCECLMWDEPSGRLTAVGLRSLQHGNGHLTFASPVDIQYNTITGEGAIYAQGTLRPTDTAGFEFGPWVPVGDQGWKTHNKHRATFRKAQDKAGKVGGKA